MNRLNKIKILASDWFEALSEDQQKEYLKLHPDSKFKHKLGLSNPDPKVIKDKQKIKEHLKGEGVDTDKNYFSLKPEHTKIIDTVAQKNKTPGTSLFNKLPKDTIDDQIKQINDKLAEIDRHINNYIEKEKVSDTGTKLRIMEVVEDLRDKKSYYRKKLIELTDKKESKLNA